MRASARAATGRKPITASYTANFPKASATASAVSSARMSRASKGTTVPGYVNRHGQVVVRATGLAGTNYGQSVYVMRCPACAKEYGANGSGIFQRRCAFHQGGMPGLPY